MRSIKNRKRINRKIKRSKKNELDKNINAFEKCLKTYIPQLFDCPIEDILNEKGLEAKAFSRGGKVSIEVLFLVLISSSVNGQGKSLASNILSIWSSVNGNACIPTREAVAKYLGYICPIKLKARILNFTCIGNIQNIKTYKGKNMYSVDGSKAKLPRNDKTIENYGLPNSGTNPGYYPQCHLVSFVELGTNICRWYEIGKSKANEKPLMLDGVENIAPGSIIIADCGFDSAGVSYLLTKKNYSFLIRINEVNADLRLRKINFINNEAIVEIAITPDMRKTYPQLEDAPKTVKVRILKVRDKDDFLRGLFLMTNMMDTTEYPKKELEKIYYERQRSEDSFRFLKEYGGLEKIHFNTEEHMIGLLMIGVIAYLNMVQMTSAQIMPTPSPNENGEITINRKVAWENIFEGYLGYKKTNQIDSNLLITLIRTINTIRCGRSFPRYSMQAISPYIRNRNKVKKEFEAQKSMRKKKDMELKKIKSQKWSA